MSIGWREKAEGDCPRLSKSIVTYRYRLLLVFQGAIALPDTVHSVDHIDHLPITLKFLQLSPCGSDCVPERIEGMYSLVDIYAANTAHIYNFAATLNDSGEAAQSQAEYSVLLLFQKLQQTDNHFETYDSFCLPSQRTRTKIVGSWANCMESFPIKAWYSYTLRKITNFDIVYSKGLIYISRKHNNQRNRLQTTPSFNALKIKAVFSRRRNCRR